MSRKAKVYSFNGEELTAKEISIRHNIPVLLVIRSFSDSKFPSLQEILDWRKANGIDDITCFKYSGRRGSNKPRTKYEHEGEYLTSMELSERYGIPERLIWKAYNDPTKPSLSEMIAWRKERGIFDKNDYRCVSAVSGQKQVNCATNCAAKAKCKKYVSLKTKYKPPKDQCVGLHVGSVYGSYEIIGETTHKFSRRFHLHCLYCGKYFHDISLNALSRVVSDSQCHCRDLSHYQIIKHLPAYLQKNSLTIIPKGMAYYQSFVGFTVCGVKITGVTKKEGNGCDIYFFSCTCPKCKTQFTVKAFNIITDTFRHTCEAKRKAKKKLLKNSSCLRKRPAIYKSNSCHVHREIDPDMIELLKTTVSFYSLEYGTEAFMDLCLDAEFLGKRQLLESVYAIS